MEVINKPLNLKKRDDISILFAEDEPITCLMLSKMLKRRFKNVYLAYDGEEGLALFKEHRPNIVLTDLFMPKMNGFEMIARIKEISPDTPIIVMSAISEKPFLEQAQKLGVTAFLIKPIEHDEFHERLNQLVENITNQK
jgi:YesN/AraC family two-component response regulator